jgi:tetratricopeptide (TPR) repeat protein
MKFDRSIHDDRPRRRVHRVLGQVPFPSRPRSTTLACGLALFATLLTATTARADYFEALNLYRTGKYSDCIEAAEKAIAEQPVNENCRTLKIRAELEVGRYQEAAKSLDEGLKRLPTSLELRWIGREVCRYSNQPDRVKQLETEIRQLVEQAAWRYSDAANRIVVAKYLLSQNVDPRKVLDGLINDVKKQLPDFTPAHLAAGELALEKGDFALAAESFEKAAKINPSDPDAHFGVAQAYDPSDSARARQALKDALDANPNHVPSLLMMADNLIDSERYDLAAEALDQVESVNVYHPQAAAYRAVLAHLRNQPADEEKFRQAALRFWPTNPRVDSTIGRKLSQKYRFAEGAQYQRRALEMDASYLPAKMQLSQDLLRLGQEEEGWRLADEISRADGYNVVAHNLMILQESLSKFQTLEEDGIIARMDAREARIYGQRVLDLLKRARRELCAKYDVKLDQPIIVEMFPRQQDFAIRTFGLPGGAGFLGVCFGTVITANSPASQTEHPTCWESTLWHEFCHVVTLNKTRNKMPRWLSEGISVYEERQADPAWGQTITPVTRKMLVADDLTPVSRLSAAYLSPASPRHLQFAYLESSLVVEFLIETLGLDALKSILNDLASGMEINDALTRHAGTLEELDSQFAEYARRRAAEMAPQADWSEPDLPARADSKALAEWLEGRPGNYAGLKRQARLLIEEKQWQAAQEVLERMREIYPRETGPESAAMLLARVYREMGENQSERAVLEELGALSADNIELFTRLTDLTTQAGDWELTRKYAVRWLGVNPLHPEPHRRAAEAAGHLRDWPLAVASNEALLQLDPIDPAEIHVRLASVLQTTGDLQRAKRHALLALEETPRFREAQKRLLEIVREIEQRNAPATGAPAESHRNATEGKR